MAFPELVENLRTMIVSHREHDDDNFCRSAETIIRSLATQNRPSEARSLKQALHPTPERSNGKISAVRPAPSTTTNLSISVLTRQTPGLVTFVPARSDRQLVFTSGTGDSLQTVLREQRASHRLAEAGLLPRRKLLFWGPPGCGKTATAQWLAHELGLPCGIVRLASLITSYVGETGANLAKVLQLANQTPMVLLLDEADAIAQSRDQGNDVGELRRVVNALLQGLDGFTAPNSLVILASNHTHLFDSALWRRFDDVIEFPLPTERDRLALLRHLTSGLKITGSLSSVAKNMVGRSFAEIERAVHDVAKLTVLDERPSTNATEILNASRRFEEKVASATTRRSTSRRSR